MKRKRLVAVKLQLFEEGFRENGGGTAHIHEGEGLVEGAIGTHESQPGVNAVAVENKRSGAGGGEGSCENNRNEKQSGQDAPHNGVCLALMDSSGRK
ncbi:MAG TPA: hypothetical protein VJN48_16645 [Terriglobales bacterium]|nr:hypothetical protein [Terriglobales bacterium]